MRLVPGYEILEELGRGGMGVVYKTVSTASAGSSRCSSGFGAGRRPTPRSWHASDKRPQPWPACITRTSCKYCRRWRTGRLPLPRVEFVEGGTLAQRLARGPLPAGQAAELVEALARAIHYAHQQNIIHRDLKPGNVLLHRIPGSPVQSSTVPGTTLSFELANLKWVRPRSLTLAWRNSWMNRAVRRAPGHLMGTPSYMAPEQAAGRSRLIGPGTDVYALGTVLQSTVSGSAAVPGCIRGGDAGAGGFLRANPAGATRPNVPRDLQTICLKCLEKEPRRRYGSAAELADDLGRYRRHEPIRARATGTAGAWASGFGAGRRWRRWSAWPRPRGDRPHRRHHTAQCQPASRSCRRNNAPPLGPSSSSGGRRPDYCANSHRAMKHIVNLVRARVVSREFRSCMNCSSRFSKTHGLL